MGFQVHQVGNALAAVQGVVHHVGNQTGVETRLLQRTVQALALGAVVV
jgi:hypothetical protein